MTKDEAQAALDAFAARRGQGRPAENQKYWDGVVGPALTVPFTGRANAMADAYSQRNSTVGDAQRQAVGGFGSALNAARAQTESEWLRRYLADKAKQGRSGGSSSSSTTAATSPTVPASSPEPDDDMWAWVDDWMNRNPTAPPSARPPAPSTTRPRTYPTVVRK